MRCVPNIPTEEIFTCPDRRRADGRVVFSRPVALGGATVSGLALEFTRGAVTRISAEGGREIVEALAASDQGAARLGEVGLVPRASPVARVGVLFHSALVDENAATHLRAGALLCSIGAERRRECKRARGSMGARPMTTRLLAASAAVLLLGGPLAAADFWLAAESWEPSLDGRVIITAGSGERFPSRAEFAWPDDWLADWRLIGAQGEVPVNRAFERADQARAVPVTLPGPGAYLGVAVVSPQRITRTGPEFTAYLKEEGLDAIMAARTSAGDAAADATQRHGHYAKIAVRSGAGLGLHLIRRVGLRAELVPAIDPTELAPGAPITVQLLVDGAPVSGATVSAVSADTVQKAITDSQGLATFSMDHPGPWLIRTVHMIRLPPSSDAQWESFGVTLAFHTAIH